VSAAISTTPVLQSAGFVAGRVYGLLSFALSIAALVLLMLNLPSAIVQGPALSWGWVGFSIAAAGIPALVALVLPRRTTPRTLQVIWSAAAVLLFTAYATVPAALGQAQLSASDGLPWLVQLAVLAGCSAALAWPTRYAIGYGILLQAALFNLVRLVDEPFPGQAMGEVLGQLFFVTFFTCLVVALRRAGLLLDQTIASAVMEAQTSAAAEKRRSARQRLDMLVHDRVIAALLSYASGAQAEHVVNDARAALVAIDAAGSAPTDVTEHSPRALVWEIQALTTQFDPEAVFEHAVDSDLPVPAYVADSLVEAASEALRNSLRHAPVDRPVTRQVRVEISDLNIELAVLDDGDGFNVNSVNPARLGIRSGIKGRMGAIPGGEAQVSSHAGYGTTVILRWRRP
jgi:hypothetical protein